MLRHSSLSPQISCKDSAFLSKKGISLHFWCCGIHTLGILGAAHQGEEFLGSLFSVRPDVAGRSVASHPLTVNSGVRLCQTHIVVASQHQPLGKAVKTVVFMVFVDTLDLSGQVIFGFRFHCCSI